MALANLQVELSSARSSSSSVSTQSEEEKSESDRMYRPLLLNYAFKEVSDKSVMAADPDGEMCPHVASKPTKSSCLCLPA